MGSLVALPLSAYETGAFDDFTVEPGFRLGTARALMWTSQLAYEMRHAPHKVEAVLTKWGLTPLELFAMDTRRLPLISTRGFVAEGHGATIVSFAGTDPLALPNWITNLNLGPRARELHRGFAAAVGAIWPHLARALAQSAAAGQPLYLTGHSLGGALALISALRIRREHDLAASGVYTFGMPRAGGPDFCKACAECGLADVTYRLVHGLDIVPSLPPSRLGFRHVGRMLACDRGGVFAGNGTLSSSDSDDPPFAETLKTGYRQRLRDLTTGSFLPSPIAGWRGWGQRYVLPPPITDHLPGRYRQALTPLPPCPSAAPRRCNHPSAAG